MSDAKKQVQTSTWEQAKDWAPLLIVLVTAMGTAGGWFYYRAKYTSHFGIDLLSLDLSLIDYLTAGLIPTTIVFALALLTLTVRRDLLHHRRSQGEAMDYKMVEKRIMVTGVMYIVGAPLLLYYSWPVPSEIVLVLLLLIGGMAASVFAIIDQRSSLRTLMVSFVSIIASMAVIYCTFLGASDAKKIHKREPVDISTTDSATQESFKGKRLTLITHADGVWYFCDTDSPWERIAVHAYSDAVITGVRVRNK